MTLALVALFPVTAHAAAAPTFRLVLRAQEPRIEGGRVVKTTLLKSWPMNAKGVKLSKPQRTVSVGKPVVTDFGPPAQPSYTPDARVGPGGRRLLDVPVQGMTSVIVRSIRRSDGKVTTDTLKSVYNPWGAVRGVAAGDSRLR